jgi:hypothetical protein
MEIDLVIVSPLDLIRNISVNILEKSKVILIKNLRTKLESPKIKCFKMKLKEINIITTTKTTKEIEIILSYEGIITMGEFLLSLKDKLNSGDSILIKGIDSDKSGRIILKVK